MPKCLECGTHYKLLNSHITRTHKISTTTYKERHGSDVQFSDDCVKEKQRENGFSPWSIKDMIKRGYTNEEAVRIINEKHDISFGRHTSVRCPEYWIRIGYSEEEAKNKIADLQSRGEDFFVEKYGEIGTEKHKKFRNKIGTSNSKDFMIANGKTEEDIRLIRDNLSIDGISKKYNISTKDAEIIRNDRMTNLVSARVLQYWIDLGYNEAEAKEHVRRIQSRNINYFVDKYGKDEGEARYSSWVEKATKNSSFSYTSIESLKFFAPLIEFCDTNNIQYQFEKFVSLSGKSGYIDMCIDSVMLALEYDGEAWHADPRIINLNWKNAKNSVTYTESIESDNRKTTLLNQLGYDVVRIHSKYKDEYDLVKILKDKLYNNKDKLNEKQ